MESKLPIVKQMAWLSILPQMMVLIIIALIQYQIDQEKFILYTGITYLAILFFLRFVIPSKHRKGIRLFKQRKFKKAIPYFQQSYKFFKKNNWIDKYRYLTLLSSSRISYTELALLNEAFCLLQIGEKEEAIRKYEDVLEEFPDSQIAKSALKLLR